MKVQTNVKAGLTVDLTVKSSTEVKSNTNISVKIDV